MIPVTFTYQRASSVDEALDLASQGEETKFLAGGHSLLPLMKLRLAVPETLIDIGRLRELSYIRDDGSHLAVGALTSHHDVATSDLLARELPLLAHAARSEEHTSELQSHVNLVCRLLLEKKNKQAYRQP